MNRPDALIFDLDGTLWDAAVPTARGWNQALEMLEVEERVSVQGIRSVAGTPFEGCVEILLPGLCPPTEATLRSLDDCEKAAIIESGGSLFSGVDPGLRSLALAYPLFVVSNCQDWYLDLFLTRNGLRECFAGGDCNGKSGLDKAEMLRRLAFDHNLKSAVYVGDTQGDLEAARDAGMDFALAGYGFGSVAEPVLRFGSFGDLTAHYLAEPSTM